MNILQGREEMIDLATDQLGVKKSLCGPPLRCDWIGLPNDDDDVFRGFLKPLAVWNFQAVTVVGQRAHSSSIPPPTHSLRDWWCLIWAHNWIDSNASLGVCCESMIRMNQLSLTLASFSPFRSNLSLGGKLSSQTGPFVLQPLPRHTKKCIFSIVFLSLHSPCPKRSLFYCLYSRTVHT